MKLANVSSFVIRHSSFRQRRRGTALMLAILMMVFVGAAITAMTTLFTHEVKRTHVAVASAQLRQLLLAADPAAREELVRNATPHDITIPTPVANATLTSHIDSTSTTATIRTVAHLSQESAVATATYTRTPTGWSLQSASLGM